MCLSPSLSLCFFFKFPPLSLSFFFLSLSLSLFSPFVFLCVYGQVCKDTRLDPQTNLFFWFFGRATFFVFFWAGRIQKCNNGEIGPTNIVAPCAFSMHSVTWRLVTFDWPCNLAVFQNFDDVRQGARTCHKQTISSKNCNCKRPQTFETCFTQTLLLWVSGNFVK